MTRSFLHPLAAAFLFIALALAAVLLLSAVIDGLASSDPSVTISVVSATPPSGTTP